MTQEVQRYISTIVRKETESLNMTKGEIRGLRNVGREYREGK